MGKIARTILGEDKWIKEQQRARDLAAKRRAARSRAANKPAPKREIDVTFGAGKTAKKKSTTKKRKYRGKSMGRPRKGS